MEQSYTTVNYGSSNSKRALPHPGLCQALVTLSVLAVGNLSENLCLGVGHLSILLEAANSVLL